MALHSDPDHLFQCFVDFFGEALRPTTLALSGPLSTSLLQAADAAAVPHSVRVFDTQKQFVTTGGPPLNGVTWFVGTCPERGRGPGRWTVGAEGSGGRGRALMLLMPWSVSRTRGEHLVSWFAKCRWPPREFDNVFRRFGIDRRT